MAWLVLVLSGLLEAVWATALGASENFRRWRPTVVFFVAMSLSMVGLAWALPTLPTGTAGAGGVGRGATRPGVWGFVTGKERATMARVGLLVLLVGSVIGLKAVS